MSPSSIRAAAHNVRRSPARTALADHIERQGQARAAAAEARRSLDRARDQAEHAQATVRTAEAALAAINERESALVNDWGNAGSPWPPPSPSPKSKQVRADAENDLAVARRMLNTVEHNAEIAQAEVARAAIAESEISKQTEAAVIAVLAEEADAAIRRVADARAKAVQVESGARSLLALLVDRRYFREAEPIGNAMHQLRMPVASINMAPVVQFAERLRADADATSEF
jgi:hypothetical protein